MRVVVILVVVSLIFHSIIFLLEFGTRKSEKDDLAFTHRRTEKGDFYLWPIGIDAPLSFSLNHGYFESMDEAIQYARENGLRLEPYSPVHTNTLR